jgi:hypothetical protein
MPPGGHGSEPACGSPDLVAQRLVRFLAGRTDLRLGSAIPDPAALTHGQAPHHQHRFRGRRGGVGMQRCEKAVNTDGNVTR